MPCNVRTGICTRETASRGRKWAPAMSLIASNVSYRQQCSRRPLQQPLRQPAWLRRSMRTRRSWPGRQPAPVRLFWCSFDIETPSRFSKAHPLAPPQPTLASSDGAALMRGWELMVRYPARLSCASCCAMAELSFCRPPISFHGITSSLPAAVVSVRSVLKPWQGSCNATTKLSAGRQSRPLACQPAALQFNLVACTTILPLV